MNLVKTFQELKASIPSNHTSFACCARLRAGHFHIKSSAKENFPIKQKKHPKGAVCSPLPASAATADAVFPRRLCAAQRKQTYLQSERTPVPLMISSLILFWPILFFCMVSPPFASQLFLLITDK